jgi:hypothetical protein
MALPEVLAAIWVLAIVYAILWIWARLEQRGARK